MMRLINLFCVGVSLVFLSACATTMDTMKSPDHIRLKPETVSASHELVFLSAGELAEKIRSRQVTSLDVVHAYLNQIETYNTTLNAIVTLDKEAALQRARKADEALNRGELWGPLHGVPITIKDNLATRGLKTTNSMTETADYVPDFDATVVARLRKAGAIILGKTNLPALAMDYQTNSPIFGITNNPWDLSRTPGGSSGGEAAAVAAGLSPLGIGNDIGGSIRIPAHFCGIYGLKPTEHSVPITGISPGLPENDYRSLRHQLSIGPLARSIDDLKLCLTIIAGPDVKDPDIPDTILPAPQKKALNDLRIAWSDDFGDVPVTEETKAALKQFTDKLAQAGCTVERINPPEFDFMVAWKTYGKLIDMELGVYTPPFARFLQYIFGRSYRKDTPTITMVYPLSYEKYLTVLTNRETCMASMNRFLSRYDVFLCPVHTTAAYPQIRPDSYFGPFSLYKQPFHVDDHSLNYMVANGSYTTIFNLTGNPVVVMPVAYTQENLPIGIQVVGARWHDMELLDVAGQLDTVADAYRRPPGF